MKQARLVTLALAMFCSLTAFDCEKWCRHFPGHGGHGGQAGAAGAAGQAGTAGQGGSEADAGMPPLGDNAATLGDDRPGYVVCDGASDGIPNATAGSVSCNGTCYEVIAASSLPICAPPPAGDRDDTQDCDGPEDCGAGLTCCALEWTFCTASCLNTIRCHVDADCTMGGVCQPGAENAHGAGVCGAP